MTQITCLRHSGAKTVFGLVGTGLLGLFDNITCRGRKCGLWRAHNPLFWWSRTRRCLFSVVSVGARALAGPTQGGSCAACAIGRRFRAPKKYIIKNPLWHTLWGAGRPVRGAGLPFGAPILRAMLRGKPSVHVLVGEKTRNALFSNLAIFPLFSAIIISFSDISRHLKCYMVLGYSAPPLCSVLAFFTHFAFTLHHFY